MAACLRNVHGSALHAVIGCVLPPNQSGGIKAALKNLQKQLLIS
jgi:hypothetical protein